MSGNSYKLEGLLKRRAVLEDPLETEPPPSPGKKERPWVVEYTYKFRPYSKGFPGKVRLRSEAEARQWWDRQSRKVSYMVDPKIYRDA